MATKEEWKLAAQLLYKMSEVNYAGSLAEREALRAVFEEHEERCKRAIINVTTTDQGTVTSRK